MERVDRISDLPEHILHHVLSFLSFQQVAQTCIVSKTWEKAWHTFPILAFDYDFFERDICNFPIWEYDSSLFEPDMQYLALFIHPYMNSDNRLKEIFSSVIDRCLGYALGCNVKELCFKLGYIHIPDYAEGVIETIIAGCPLLEDLSVGYSRGFKSLKLFGLPKLNKVEVEEMSNLERLEMKAFNVQVFSIAWSDIPRHLDITLYDDFTLSKSTTLCFFSKFEMDTEWYFKYIELLRKFHTLSKLLNLMTKRGENVIFPVALRQTISPLFCGMKHFELITEVSPPSVAIKDIVDGLLWISPHAKTLAIKSVYSHIFCLEFEFSYKKEPVYEGEICECCNSVPISCWRQCIEKVEIKYTSYKQIKGYVFEGEEIWEMMDCLTGLTTSH
ncbi:hypothetical protein Pint_28877 [Pistacia integerrima]|uniref:Uncharacterized protein n=1 Tax=Pistacia integerrima TaxID=434235 RepID=A0ACC0X0K1_9ROSI|nr:hypothetical protein Pint_28877 [Pistacia integerrima]